MLRNKSTIQILISAFIFLFHQALSQKQQLPEPVTNAASALASVNGQSVVYSFYGLDSTKDKKGVHKKAFSYNLKTKETKRIANVPDEYGRLASSASTIKNKIYILGGYAVFPDGKEKSSSHLFIFDPENGKYIQGKSLPVPIDDHMQAVWRDSLLFVISGWSDSLNVSSVQLYNPTTNEWKQATPVPEEADAKVFGGSGIIVGDTIYYLGGARFEKFYPGAKTLYKGVINGKEPSLIRWINVSSYPGVARYRSAAFHHTNKIYFIGGSHDTYNYNGISYRSKSGVDPNTSALIFNIRTQKFEIKNMPTSKRVMDLRNILKTDQYTWAVVGGMKRGQKVSSEILFISPTEFE